MDCFDSDFDDGDFLLPPMGTFITPSSSSNAAGMNSAAVPSRGAAEILALDTEAEDDPDLTQLPTPFKRAGRNYNPVDESPRRAAGGLCIDFTEEDEAVDLTGEVENFMASQHILSPPGDPLPQCQPAGPPSDEFVRSDEELSDLECFTSIDQLLARGGDEKRRVEFILKQFRSGKRDETEVRAVPASRRTPAGAAGARSLGIRRNVR